MLIIQSKHFYKSYLFRDGQRLRSQISQQKLSKNTPLWVFPHLLHRAIAVRRGRVSILGLGCLSPPTQTGSDEPQIYHCMRANKILCVPLSCAPAAIRFPSACGIPGMDRTTIKTEPPKQMNSKTYYLIDTFPYFKLQSLVLYLFIQSAARHLQFCHSGVCYFFSVDLFSEKNTK